MASLYINPWIQQKPAHFPVEKLRPKPLWLHTCILKDLPLVSSGFEARAHVQHMLVYIQLCMHIHSRTYTNVYAQAQRHRYGYTNLYIHTCRHKDACMHMYAQGCTHRDTYACTHAYTHPCTYTGTYSKIHVCTCRLEDAHRHAYKYVRTQMCTCAPAGSKTHIHAHM